MSIWVTDFMLCGDDPAADGPAPIRYQRSHIYPRPEHPRAGTVDTAHIPAFLTPDGRDDDAEDGPLPPWLRLAVDPGQPGEDTVILDAAQVAALRDHLTWWLHAVRHNPTTPEGGSPR